MIPLLLPLALVQSPDSRLERLGRERAAFDAEVDDKALDTGYPQRMYCMLMGSNGCAMALYPTGVSNRRFLLITWSGGGQLLFQKRVKGRPTSLWKRDLKYSAKPSRMPGTMPRYLADRGLWFVKAPTRVQRQDLGYAGDFATYLPDPVDSLWVSYVSTRRKEEMDPDVYGTNPMTLKSPVLPITALEAKALGWGTKSWSPDPSIKVSHPTKESGV